MIIVYIKYSSGNKIDVENEGKCESETCWKEKKQNTNVCYKLSQPQKHWSKKKSQIQRPRIMWLHLYETYRIGKSIKI